VASSLLLSTRRTFWTYSSGMFGIYTHVHFDSHMYVRLPIVHSLCFGVTSLNRLQLLQALTDIIEIRLFVCSWMLHCWRRSVLKSDVVERSYESVPGLTFSRTHCLPVNILTLYLTIKLFQHELWYSMPVWQWTAKHTFQIFNENDNTLSVISKRNTDLIFHVCIDLLT